MVSHVLSGRHLGPCSGCGRACCSRSAEQRGWPISRVAGKWERAPPTAQGSHRRAHHRVGRRCMVIHILSDRPLGPCSRCGGACCSRSAGQRGWPISGDHRGGRSCMVGRLRWDPDERAHHVIKQFATAYIYTEQIAATCPQKHQSEETIIPPSLGSRVVPTKSLAVRLAPKTRSGF